MSGRRLVIGFLAFLAVFAAALVWFQFFAFYERQEGVGALTIDGVVVPVAGYDGIDSTSSPLKLRGCLAIDPRALANLAPAPDASLYGRALHVGTLRNCRKISRVRIRSAERVRQQMTVLVTG